MVRIHRRRPPDDAVDFADITAVPAEVTLNKRSRRLVPGAARAELDVLMHTAFDFPIPAAAELRVVDLAAAASGHRIGRSVDCAAVPDVLLYPDHGAEQMAAHLASIGVYVGLYPNLGGEHAVALAIAPIVAMLDTPGDVL